MPSEHPQSQSHTRPALGNHRSTSSINSHSDSPNNTPPQNKTKVQKHVVGGGRLHARVPSNKGIHKLTKTHGIEGSHDNLKKLGRNSSATHLKNNNSHVSLKRNQSSTDVTRRPKSSHGQSKRPASVHFEIGEQEDAWEEASSSASPALSRSASRPGSSAKQSASNSEAQSPQAVSFKSQPAIVNGSDPTAHPSRSTADAKIITERLLQRTPSHHTTKMSLATATPATTTTHSSDSLGKSQSTTSNSTPKIGSNVEVVSRFVSGSGTPSESQHYLHNRNLEPKAQDDIKRAQSMGNLTRRDSERDEEEERALAPRSRKSSTSNAYNPPQQSRTQQKLWLQRASSNIEPQQMTPGVTLNGLSALHGGLGGTSLLGAGYDGRDPRIKQQLERTGLEYLVVRRHQDPIGKSLKRINQIPGVLESRRIPTRGSDGARHGTGGLSQSLKDGRRKENTPAPVNGGGASGRTSFDNTSNHPPNSGGHRDSDADRNSGVGGNGDDSVASILRSLWEKNFDFSSSAD